MAAGRQPQRARVHQGPALGHADGRCDPQDKIAEAHPQDAAGDPPILNKTTSGYPGPRPKKDDLLRKSIIIKI